MAISFCYNENGGSNMKIELIGALDYTKLKEELKEKVENVDELISILKNNELERKVEIVSTAGRLSRNPGTVFDVLATAENNPLEKNLSFIKRVVKMGHDSITDHDYCVFAIENVSPVIEQTIIAERFSSFTIKSRREVDFSKVGYYIPDFHNKNGELLENNEQIKEEYINHENSLFADYEKLVSLGVPLEDARFVLPYSYYSNIIMGVDAHTLKDMIIKYTKTKYSKITEIREFGEILYEIAKKEVPFIIDEIDKIEVCLEDSVEQYLHEKIADRSYQVLDKPKLLSHSSDVDDTILLSAIMRRYQFDQEKAKKVYKLLSEDKEFKQELMRKIAFESDKLELSQVSFEFQIPLSFAILTHLTRHRTHHIMVPDFSPIVDLTQYKVPPKIKSICKETFDAIFTKNLNMYNHFKEDYEIREEDLIYFTLSGNMVNVITNMDGKTVEHILRLRECTKAQWETRNMANGIHNEIRSLPDARCFSNILGPTCETQRFCKEGKESCGKILKLIKNEE